MQVDAQQVVRIDLTLVDGGGRRMDSTPDDVRIGAVCLKQWQVDRIEAPLGMFAGFEAHLIKINYELTLEPNSPPMTWFEIAFEFLADGEGNSATVVDALPRFGTSAESPKSYTLNRFLNFVPCEESTSAHALVPATTDRIDMFGVGGKEVCWRHVSHSGAGVHHGSYAAWVVLLTPAGQSGQRVEFSARYDLLVGSHVQYRPTQSPTAFLLSLSDASEAVSPSLSAYGQDQSDAYHPSVFICYAHDSARHKRYALRFANLLTRNGIRVHLDQWDVDQRKDWAIWARKLIDKVDFVIVLASPICRKAFDGDLNGPDNPGIQSEAQLIRERLHTRRDVWTAKVLPVVLPHELVDNIPEMLQPWTADHYDIRELTREGIDELLRAMTGIPRYSRPPLGELPPDVLKPLRTSES
ncbi:TIR domain-containing protein [Streptomyces achromogenes]|uniref:TIR domain-containing protein n=1 Tax=Streptomyces achromogenes TaxID=67255 RepID=UPI0037001D37